MRRIGIACVVLGACAPGGGAVDDDVDAAVDADALPAWATPIDGGVEARCGALALRATALDDGVLRLAYGEAPPARPWSAIEAPPVAGEVEVATDGDAVIVRAPALAVTIAPDCRIVVRDAAGNVLVDDGDDGGVAIGAGGVVVTRATPAGERFYGLGEKTGGLDRRGRRWTLWSTDAYDPALGGWRPDADPLYASIPFLIGLRDGVAYGLLVDDTHRLELDLAAADPARYAIASPATAHVAYVIAGPSIREVTRRHTAMTGRTPRPPRWALGYHQSRWGYWPAARLEELARGFRDRGLGADALWLDIQHLRGFRTFTWDPVGFPDPAGLTGALADDGFRLVAIADPGIKAEPGWDVFDEGVAGGHFLRDADGAIYEGVVWPGPSAFPDFTQAATRAWWGARVGDLVDDGVDGIWLDVNEPTTFPEGGGGASVPDALVTGEGATMAEVHNVYAVLEARATFEGLRAAAPGRRPFVLSRAGGSGIQRWAAMWTGDAPSTWDALGQTLPMLLGLGLSGVPLVGSDVGGYSGGATPELFARWMALGSVSPFFRGHVTSGVADQEPWAFGPEVEEISRRAIRERYRTMPYLEAVVAEAAETGAPVLRPLVFEFQDDPATWDLDDQAMLGAWVMVAPVTAPGATSRQVYLPAGRWFDARSGAVFDGPATIEVDVTLQALPTFVREGAILPAWPRGAALEHAGSPAPDTLWLDVYPGATAGALVLVDDDGDGDAPARRIRYTLEATRGGATLRAERLDGGGAAPARDLRIRLRRVDAGAAAVRLDGAALAGWTWDGNDRSVIVTLPDRDAFALEVDFDRALEAPAPPVRVAVDVRVPDGAGPVHVASSANGWVHQPLVQVDATTWRGELEVPRGAWFHYKFSRGGWDTVEKQADCGELANRYRFGAADDAQVDVVSRWRDDCE